MKNVSKKIKEWWQRVSEEKFGRWWIEPWEDKSKVVTIGLGECFFTEGNGGPYFIRIKRFWKLWLAVSRPSLGYLKERRRYLKAVEGK